MMMSFSRVVWCDGAFVCGDEAFVPALNRGVLHGDGCFETLVSCCMSPFAFSRHYERLTRTCDLMGLIGLPLKEELFQACRELMRQNRLLDPVHIRIVVLAHGDGASLEREVDRCSTVIMTAHAQEAGEFCTIVPSAWVRSEKGALCGVKSLSAGENVMALREAKREGADEAVLGNSSGNLCDGTESNIFWVEDGAVYTPPLSAGVVPGVTRSLVFELCEELGIPCEERDVPFSMLDEVSEIFLTSTQREVQPITKVGDRRLVAGSTTLLLRKAYRDMVDDLIDP